jgi:hypothetical protein
LSLHYGAAEEDLKGLSLRAESSAWTTRVAILMADIGSAGVIETNAKWP